MSECVMVDDLAQEIRRVDGSHSLGAGALAEALAPWIAARDREVAAKVLRDTAERVQRALPGLLIEDADSDDGWLSDAQNAQVMADHYAVSFCGEGSIDIHQIASIAAVLIEKGASDGEH